MGDDGIAVLAFVEHPDDGWPWAVLDAGGGASQLVDRLLEASYADVTVVDISEASLARVRDRLPENSPVRLIRADLLDWEPTRTFDVWHDRAVFHFLVDPAARLRCTTLVARSLRPGGALVLGSFEPQGPTTCSGLPTARYDPAGLNRVWTDGFVLEHAEQEDHATPWGTTQQFTWALFRRRQSGQPFATSLRSLRLEQVTQAGARTVAGRC
ncbi:class I SAM-dependent methyltransferase [Friedmanniella luteola]|uniref:class I SAM-dependent methyltransferase n=1 Tax=Friedmanniella luteola TaxID=546871 RepID=UPI000B88A39A